MLNKSSVVFRFGEQLVLHLIERVDHVHIRCTMSKELQQKHCCQKYRREREKESWARGWLSFSKKSVSKAYCCFCDRDLVVGKSELISHSKTSVHVSHAQKISSNRAISDVFEVKNKHKMAAELITFHLIFFIIYCQPCISLLMTQEQSKI